MSGAGISSAASSLSAGHSASAAKTLTQTLNAAGTFSTITSGTESATDGTVTATVQASLLQITGSLDGTGTVMSLASVEAYGDENFGTLDVWVGTLIQALTDVQVDPGVHGTATARATGTATARGTLAGSGTVTGLSQGTATASSDARDLFANGAVADAQSQISSESWLYLAGTGIRIDNRFPISTRADTWGGGTASASASGSSQGTATSDTNVISGTVSVSGRTAASATSSGDSTATNWNSASARVNGYYNTGTSGSEDKFAQLYSESDSVSAGAPPIDNFQGSASSSATGTSTASGWDTIAGATFRDIASGSVASAASQQLSDGYSSFQSVIFAQDGGNLRFGAPIGLYIPRMGGLGNDYVFDISGQNLDGSEVSSTGSIIEGGNSGSGSSSATGSASTMTSIGGERTSTMANGRTAISGALSGVMVNLDGEAAIRSQSVADGSTDYDLTGPGHQGIFDTDAGAVSLVKGWVEATGSPDRVTGSVSATGQTTASAVYDDGVRDADAASRAQAVIQGNIAGDDADPAFGAISYGFAFTGSAADGGLLFYFTPVTDFAVSQSAVEADGQVQNVFNPTGLQSASGRITGGSGHGDAGFAVPAVRSVDAISDVSASSDVNTRTTNSVGVSETWTGSTQGSAMFPFDTAYVWTLSDAVTRAENPAGLAGSTGSFNAGITGTRTSGRGTYDSFVLPNTYSVSSDGSVVGSTRSTETTSGITSALTRTSAHVGSWGLHDAITDRAFVESYYFAQDQGLDGANQRGTATITGLTLTGHSASEGDSARLSLTGGLAQVNLNTLPNSATIAFPVRTAILGGTPAATLGVDQGVRTGMSTTAAPNFAYGEWAGVVDSDNPAVTVFWPI